MKIIVYTLFILSCCSSMIGMDLSEILNEDPSERNTKELVHVAKRLLPAMVSKESVAMQPLKSRKRCFFSYEKSFNLKKKRCSNNPKKDGLESYQDKIKVGIFPQVAFEMQKQTYTYETPDFWGVCPAKDCEFICERQSNESQVRSAISDHLWQEHRIPGVKVFEQPIDFDDVHQLKNPIFYCCVEPRAYWMYYNSNHETFMASMRCDGCDKVISDEKITELAHKFKKDHILRESQEQIQAYIINNSEKFQQSCCQKLAKQDKRTKHIIEKHMKITELFEDKE